MRSVISRACLLQDDETVEGNKVPLSQVAPLASRRLCGEKLCSQPRVPASFIHTSMPFGFTAATAVSLPLRCGPGAPKLRELGTKWENVSRACEVLTIGIQGYCRLNCSSAILGGVPVSPRNSPLPTSDLAFRFSLDNERLEE